jgi:predicted nucleic acid-binding protein
MGELTYDTGALVAAERGDLRMWAIHRRALERRQAPTVPAAVLVEAWRGHPAMARLVRGCHIEPLDPASARAAAQVRAACAAEVSATDATVAEWALRNRQSVVTSDRADLEALAAGVNRRLDVIDI